MEVGPGRHAPGYPARLQGGVGTELHGALPFDLPVIGDIACSGDLVAAGQGVQRGAELRARVSLKAGGELYAHAGAQIDRLAGGDDVGAGNP